MTTNTDRMAAGSARQELEALFRRHGSGLAGAIRGVLGHDHDVAEVLQDTFLKACRALDRGPPPRRPEAWLFVVALNAARDRLRQSRRRPAPLPLLETTSMDVETQAALPGQGLERKEAVAAARAAIATLKEPLKEVFLLRVSAGLTFQAIAEALTIPVGTAKTRMRRALQGLRRQLAGWEDCLQEGRRRT